MKPVYKDFYMILLHLSANCGSSWNLGIRPTFYSVKNVDHGGFLPDPEAFYSTFENRLEPEGIDYSPTEPVRHRASINEKVRFKPKI